MLLAGGAALAAVLLLRHEEQPQATPYAAQPWGVVPPCSREFVVTHGGVKWGGAFPHYYPGPARNEYTVYLPRANCTGSAPTIGIGSIILNGGRIVSIAVTPSGLRVVMYFGGPG